MRRKTTTKSSPAFNRNSANSFLGNYKPLQTISKPGMLSNFHFETNRAIGFKTGVEVRDFVNSRGIKPIGFGYNKEQKHFVEYKPKPKTKTNGNGKNGNDKMSGMRLARQMKRKGATPSDTVQETGYNLED